ncbi:MAG: DNA-directed RNA polymerase subunit beta [Elusimicrobia bacterium]|nr:MAG: DNA-directed RNA polymerase subunit beta [Elusimicrobiota bacterium]KAF0157484.1 MAG: DNA-directed RNA polymerase subunit beta [Elusimicrobiota bacterium]
MKTKDFSKIPQILKAPDLLDMQKHSFDWFLQLDTDPEERNIQGLQASFMDVFPVESADGSMQLDFVKYELGDPKYHSPEEALTRGGTYASPLRVWMSLSEKQASGKLKQVTEQDVTLCDLPLMTDNGSFIFNGAERIVVSQLHRSPGVIFEDDEEKKQSVLGKPLHFARIIPYRGAWVEFEFDLDNVLWVRLDRKKKILATTFLKASGLETNSEILNIFYEAEEVAVSHDNASAVIGKYAIEDIVDKANGEVVLNLEEKVAPIDDKTFKHLLDRKIKSVRLIKGNPRDDNPGIILALEAKNQPKSSSDARHEIYKKMRGQDFIVKEQAEDYLNTILYKSLRRYDFSLVGRYKAQRKLKPLYDRLNKTDRKFKVPGEKVRNLTIEDVLVTIKYLLALNTGVPGFDHEGEKFQYEVDDIDHLGNRRVRSIGELLENQIRVALVQIGRNVRDRMNKEEKKTPRELINAAPVVAIIRKFFGTSQLSQFMDQINPLAELTHKRRLSALGPGGLNRKRAGFEVRDVHYTHYGRVCPIETPEGANIGLIVSLAAYAKVNQYGLIETPYRKVAGKKPTAEVEYLTANKEDDIFVGQANTPVDSGRFSTDQIYGRIKDDYVFVDSDKVRYMDVSPMQVVSISAACIPFLEHDDANRALMGSNMQRQAVPLLLSEAPLVATGMEPAIARDSRACVTARTSGKVIYTDGDMIAIKPDHSKDPDIYHLIKYRRSNQDTCVNQVPIVKSGDTVKKGDIIADGPATSNGQLALGKNALVAFMSWEGYNYEDAILVSERLVEEDAFTSIFIEEFEVEARDTKLGPEEITRDIPNVGSDALENIDADGVVVPSTIVRPGDILVCKVSPKGEQQLSPEERLLKVIFGKKAEDVTDTSLRVPPGVNGKIIGTRVFVRREKLTKPEERQRVEEINEEMRQHLEALKNFRKESLENKKAADIEEFCRLMEKKIRDKYAREKELLKQTGELSVTVNKVVKVYIALKRRLQVGDKLSGRHGNKGVVARILPKEDMPYMPDGTPIDVVLSPLGVPSRMNIGQILETMLGWAGHHLNTQMVCPVFDGASEDEVIGQIREAKKKLIADGVPAEYLPDDYCRIRLYDGRTGEPFKETVTIGYLYVLKLIHLVEDKVHARSTGPYSLITRQPLGGKALFGGQRFGEMEVWALEGYGAAYMLQEMLTVKSDDFVGRTKMYEAIIKGEFPPQPGVPESFKVLVKELQALALDVDLIKTGDVPAPAAAPAAEEAGKEKPRKKAASKA